MPKRFYVRLDASFNTDEKIMDLPMAARGLFVSLLAWSKTMNTDGKIPAKVPVWLTSSTGDANQPLMEMLLQRGLLLPTEEGWCFPEKAYAEWQETTENVAAKREARVEAGRAGGIASGEARRASAADKPGRFSSMAAPLFSEADDCFALAWKEFPHHEKWTGSRGAALGMYRTCVGSVEQADEILEAIRNYRVVHPDGMFNFKNFIENEEWRSFTEAAARPPSAKDMGLDD